MNEVHIPPPPPPASACSLTHLPAKDHRNSYLAPPPPPPIRRNDGTYTSPPRPRFSVWPLPRPTHSSLAAAPAAGRFRARRREADGAVSVLAERTARGGHCDGRFWVDVGGFAVGGRDAVCEVWDSFWRAVELRWVEGRVGFGMVWDSVT